MMKMPSVTTKVVTATATTKKPSMWVRNVQLAGFSILIGVLQISASWVFKGHQDPATSAAASSSGFFHGFSGIVWLMVANNAFGGLCVAMVIKYADNILKGFACALATICASLASVYFSGFHLGFTFPC